MQGHGGNVSGLDVSLDGGAIATAADDRTVRIYRLEDAIRQAGLHAAFAGSLRHGRLQPAHMSDSALLCWH